MVETVSVSKCVAAAVATLVLDQQRVLLGRRLRQGQFEGWQCPGGYLEAGEQLSAAAQRYCQQRAGITIREIREGPYTSNLFEDTSILKHTVTLYQVARPDIVVDPVRFGEWHWFEFNALPDTLFLPLERLLEKYELTQLNVD